MRSAQVSKHFTIRLAMSLFVINLILVLFDCITYSLCCAFVIFYRMFLFALPELIPIDCH
jgi:hypothetical protein